MIKTTTMKFYFSTFILYFIFSLLASAQEKPFKRYNLKSGIIEYELSGMQTGKATTYFDDYGMKEATYEKYVANMYGEKQEFETINYLLGYWQYYIDEESGISTKSKNTTLAALVENTKDGDLVPIGKKLFASMGGRMSGNETFLGKKCDIWEMEAMGTRIWVWENIPLKTETQLMGITIHRKAVRIEENASVPETRFELPKGVTFIEVENDYLENLPIGGE